MSRNWDLGGKEALLDKKRKNPSSLAGGLADGSAHQAGDGEQD